MYHGSKTSDRTCGWSGCVTGGSAPSLVEPVGVGDERVENENHDDGEGQDKVKIDEGDMNNNETGETGGCDEDEDEVVSEEVDVTKLMFLLN